MKRILLLGGDGFLGHGLQCELVKRNLQFKSVDKEDMDLHDERQISALASVLHEFSDVVILASKIGIDIFETQAEEAAKYNMIVGENILHAIELASQRFSQSFNVVYYSTSEVFGSLSSANEVISHDSEYSFDFKNPRHLYSYVKFQEEKKYLRLNEEHQEMVSSVKILRPFNIYGENQRRGVVYEMIKSAILEKRISYRRDTTRTFTDVDLASKLAVNAILEDRNLKVNLVDPRNSLTMKSLAKIISTIIQEDCQMVELPEDHSIQYRQVSKVDEDVYRSIEIMRPHILKLAKQIRQQEAI